MYFINNFFICLTLTVTTIFALACQSSQTKGVSGQVADYKLTVTMRVNNLSPFNTFLWGFDTIIIEPYLIKQNHIKMNVYHDQKKEIDTENSFSSDSLAGYFVSSVNTNKAYTFDAKHNFIKEIPRSDKKNGFLFERNISPIAPFIADFKLSGDTMVEGQTRKLLRLLKNKDGVETEYRITMDQLMFNKINIHPISEDLDLKFKGTCMSLEILSKYKNEQSKVQIFCKVSHDLSSNDQNIISYFKQWQKK